MIGNVLHGIASFVDNCISCVCTCPGLGLCVCHVAPVEVRGQLLGECLPGWDPGLGPGLLACKASNFNHLISYWPHVWFW